MFALTDTQLIAGILLAAAYSVSLVAIPSTVRSKCIPLLTLIAALAYYRSYFVGFILVAGIAYLSIHWISRQAPSRRWSWSCAFMIILVLVFVGGRVGHWDRQFLVPGHSTVALFSLDMWAALRLMTLFWEVGSGTSLAPSFAQYAVWMCLPFTLGGPIVRWSQMPHCFGPEPKWFRSPDWWREGAAATAKLAAGVGLGVGQQFLASHLNAHFFNNAVSTFFSGPFGFYLTMAGYFQWMELLGRPCGVKIPQSFNYPIGRDNISAFWMNWNMTATFVFRDYLFYNRWGRQTYNIYFNTILLFTLVGLWHSTNAYWILWGFLHGLLFCTFLLWRKYNSRLGHLPLRGTRVANLAARCLTYFAVCMAWYLPSKIIQQVSVIAFHA